MALSFNRVLLTADAIAELCEESSDLVNKIQKILTYNSNQAIDWAAGSTPSYITEDANGNISNKNYSRQSVANAIGSLNWIKNLLTNQSMTGSQGDHLGNLNQLAKPNV